MKNGTILLVGQVLYEDKGALSCGNGITIFTNHSSDGSGPWSTMPAPVPVPTAYNNYCPNYTSPLLASTDGMTVLELASDYVGTICTMFYGTGPILAGTHTASLTATPASPSTAVNQTLSIGLTVAGTAGPVPNGTITFTSGSHTSNALALANGSVIRTSQLTRFRRGRRRLPQPTAATPTIFTPLLTFPLPSTLRQQRSLFLPPM